MFSYIVACTFQHPSVADEWIEWLRDEHLGDVCDAGANSAEVIRCDPPEGTPVRCEVHYRFESRSSFEEYLHRQAPRLREEGLRKFPPERGLTYERSTGEIVATCSRSA